jgi:hypothetical protein
MGALSGTRYTFGSIDEASAGMAQPGAFRESRR